MVTRVVVLLNKTLGDQIGEQMGGEQITALVYIDVYFRAYNRVIWQIHISN